MKKLFGLTALAGICGASLCLAQAPDPRPNILFIVADDLGYTDIGAFGGEIPTPNLDSLAYRGVRMTNLHTAPACQPSRVMLMSSNGVSDALETRPPLENGERDNQISLEYAILPELMQDAGYETYMAGKWDIGFREGYLPADRGFDRSFVQPGASASHFSDPLWDDENIYQLDGVPIPYEDLPEDFYSTDYYTDKIIEFIGENDGSTPWFAYVPYTSPHWPLQVPEEDLFRYAGHYDAGYDVLREQRMERASALGVIPEGANPEDFEPLAPRWDELTDEQRRKYARSQEIYAAMVENLDKNVGRLIRNLEETGRLENTVVVFTSDHGASVGEHGHKEYVPGQPGPKMPDFIDNSFENWGRRNSFIDHGLGFGEAATAPFRGHKATLNEGGLRAAGFIYYPPKISAGAIDHEFKTFMDFLPTFLEIADSEHPGPGPYKGRTIKDIKGQSFWSSLIGQSEPKATTVGWKYRTGGAIIRDGFKLINAQPGVREATEWQLYDLSKDPGERNDLSQEMPDLTADMVTQWEAEWR